MTELYFKGKEFVYNHHLTVPHRPLEMHADKGIGDPRLDGNLILQGDNLHALKALLPIYAGKVDCVFIDPPYNTGHEGWAYSDNVNAPMIKEWLESNPIGIDDGLRHDKWCAMMWPRLRLLWELLSETGSIWITISDIEVHRMRNIMDEIFGKTNFIASIAWQKKQSPQSDAINISDMHDYVVVYAKHAKEDKKDASGWQRRLIAMSDGQSANYGNQDQDERGPWTDSDYTCNKTADERPNLFYPIINPNNGEEVWPSRTRVWAFEEKTHKQNEKDKLIWWPPTRSKPRIKTFLKEGEETGSVPGTWWSRSLVGDNQESKRELIDIFGHVPFNFQTPKPTRLIKKILEVATAKDSLILDSFSGSGTTAQAVLEANKADGGQRRFILIEMEDYADKLTAERVRRVMAGYDFKGTQNTELLREKLNWKKLQSFQKIVEQVEKIENLHGHEYDKVKKTVKDGELIVTGERRVDERVEGLGGEFTYCTLGAPIEMDKVLTGETLPPFVNLATVLFHTATNLPGDPAKVDADTFFMGEANGQMLWLVYKPELNWLKTQDAALSLSFARKIAKEHPKARHLVFAPANHTNPKMLAKEGLKVEFAPLPYALYRVEKA